jgi:hypothetical protein
MSKSESFARHQASAEGIGVGKLIEGDAERDAIHIAVAPSLAGEKLYPGQHVGPNTDGRFYSTGVKKIGIVDPFLTGVVFPEQSFWVFLYPGTITSLRHMWTHPAYFEESGGLDVTQDESGQGIPGFAAALEAVVEVLPGSIRKKNKPADPKAAAQEFMEDFARTHGMYSAASAIDYGRRYLVDGDYMNVGEMESWYVDDDYWDAFEILTGEKVDPDQRGSFFSCSC